MTAEVTTSGQNQIRLYDTSDYEFATLNDVTSVSLAIDSNGVPSYNSTTVSRVEATLDTDLTIQTTGSGLTVNDVRAEGSGSGVSSVFSWADPTGGGPELVFSPPAATDEWMKWNIGYGTSLTFVPDGSDTPVKKPFAPIKMPVKIVRR